MAIDFADEFFHGVWWKAENFSRIVVGSNARFTHVTAVGAIFKVFRKRW